VLEAEHLTKSYPSPAGDLTVLADVSLTLAAGEAVAITGPSGSGKSTLLYILGALEPPTTGSVRLNGQNPYELDPVQLARFRNRQVGFVFQDHSLLPQCSVEDNVLVPTLVGERDPKAKHRARALIETVGLGQRLDHHPAALSGGEKQRVAIARALIREPHLLLCDEPTGNLDSDTAERVADLLMGLHERQNVILVVVTHSEALASRFAKRWRIDHGHLSAR
jgi:lipoprotein-releasing system ATP-binding protein